MSLAFTGEDVNAPTKIKAINPHIIVSGSAEQPYYSIEYYDVEKEQFYIGYSSCYLSTVYKWLNECFDVVAGDADVIIRNLKVDKEALIAGQETLQKALAEKDKEIERLNDALINKCIYLSNDETTEYCVNGPCPEFKTESQIKAEAIKELINKVGELTFFSCDVEFVYMSDIIEIGEEMVGETE